MGNGVGWNCASATATAGADAVPMVIAVGGVALERSDILRGTAGVVKARFAGVAVAVAVTTVNSSSFPSSPFASTVAASAPSSACIESLFSYSGATSL